jgi:hypothetical protein
VGADPIEGGADGIGGAAIAGEGVGEFLGGHGPDGEDAGGDVWIGQDAIIAISP